MEIRRSVPLVQAPEQPLSMRTRRAFVWIGLAVASGAVLGSAGGCSSGPGRSQPAERDADADADADAHAGADAAALRPTGDADLDELHRLAVAAPIEELVAMRLQFVVLLDRTYPDDPVLWRGIARIADRLVGDPAFPDRARMARLLQQVIAGHPVPPGFDATGICARLAELPR